MGQVVSNYTANWQKTKIKVLEFQLKCFENPFGYPFNLSRRAQSLVLFFFSRAKRFTRNSDATRKHCRIGYSTAAQKVRRHTSRADSKLFHPLEFFEAAGVDAFSHPFTNSSSLAEKAFSAPSTAQRRRTSIKNKDVYGKKFVVNCKY